MFFVSDEGKLCTPIIQDSYLTVSFTSASGFTTCSNIGQAREGPSAEAVS